MGQAIAMATIPRLMFITKQKFFRSVVIAFYEVRFKFRYIMIFSVAIWVNIQFAIKH